MISGTNGLMGAADGAFLLHKEKRTSCEAVLDISGRDQPDQTLHLNRNAESLLWELETADMQVFEEREEPVLTAVARLLTEDHLEWTAVARLLTEDHPEWTGSPTELAEAIGADIPPNKLTMKLGINASRLFNEYGISFEKSRTRSSRQIMLRRNVTGA